MTFRTFVNKDELFNQYFNQTLIQRGILNIHWDSAIKYNKMLHLLFVPDSNSALKLDKKYIDSMLKNDEIYESSNLAGDFNHIDWLYLFGDDIELKGDYDSQTIIPFDINYKILHLFGEKYSAFFKRRLGCINIPVEVTISHFNVTEFNISGKNFDFEYDFPLYFPIAKIINIKQIDKTSIGALADNIDLTPPRLDFLYAASFAKLDLQILKLYEQIENEIYVTSAKQAYSAMIESKSDNIFVSLRSSNKIANNEILKLFIQDYNADISFIEFQREFQKNYYQKHKDSLGKVAIIGDSLFNYNILVREILDDDWCKVDVLKANICDNEGEECQRFNKHYNQIYLQNPQSLRIAQGYLRCEYLSNGSDFI